MTLKCSLACRVSVLCGASLLRADRGYLFLFR